MKWHHLVSTVTWWEHLKALASQDYLTFTVHLVNSILIILVPKIVSQSKNQILLNLVWMGLDPGSKVMYALLVWNLGI